MIELDTIISSAALSMSDDIFVSWGSMRTFNEAVDDTAKFDAAIMIAPSSDEGKLAGGNQLTETQVAGIGIFVHSDVANDTDTTRRVNIRRCKAIGRELFSRVAALAQDYNTIRVNGYSFIPPDKSATRDDIDSYFNVYDAQLDGVGMVISVDRTFVSDPCYEGSGRAVIPVSE